MPSLFSTSCRTIFVAAASLIVVSGLWAAAPEDKLPADVSLVVLLDKPSEAATRWQATALGSALTGKDFAPFYSQLDKSGVAAPLYPRPALGLDWSDIARFKEPAALALLEAAPNKPAMVFLATGKGDAAEVKRVLIAAEKYFDSRKARRTVRKEGGGDITTYEMTAPEGKEPSVCIHITKGDLFAATNSPAAASKLLKLWEGGDKGSLLADADFTKVDAHSRRLADKKSVDARWFVRPLTLARLLQPAPEKRARGKNWVEIAGRQGVNAVTGIGGVVSLQPDKSHDLEVASLVVARRPFEKGLRIAEFKPGKPIEPPVWVEADVGGYLSWSWDFLAALDGAGDWLDEKMDDKGLLNSILADIALNKEVDLRKDVLPRMGPGMFAITDSHRAKDPSNPTGFRMLLGVQSKEQQKLAKKMPGLTRDDDEKIKNEYVAGNAVRYAPPGQPLFTEPDEERPVNTKAIQAYAIMPSLTLLSTDLAWLRPKLTGKEKGKPLAEDPAYRQVSAWTSAQENERTCLRGFLRSDQSWQMDYDAVRGGGVGDKSRMQARILKFLLLGNSATKETSTALPPFDALAPNLLPTGISVAVSPDGFEFKAAVLRKE